MPNPRIKVLLSSDCDYEDLVAEIYVDEKFVALLNQDEGVANLKIEFPGCLLVEDMLLRTMKLEVFEEALAVAKTKLLERKLFPD